MTLNFTEARTYDPGREMVCFVATNPDAGDAPIACAVSREALEDYAGGDGTSDVLSLFDKFRAEIFAAAEIKRMRGHAEQDGSVLLKRSDLSS
jgi:hypothetical protein